MILAPTLTLSAGSGAAIVRPTFSRDFAGEKTLNNGTGPAITFTRASNATFFNASGVLQTASNDAPRFDHDPATGASRGLLIEEARTNLLERSAEFDNAYWTKTRASVTANAIAAPDGTTTADKLVENTDNNTHILSRNETLGSVAMSFSVFVKAGERTRARIRISDLVTSVVSVDVNLSDGTLSAVTAQSPWTSGSATISNVGNGWYRVALTATAGQGTLKGVSVDLLDATGAHSYTGDGTSGLFIWGAQLEAGAFPTSYIPTTTAAATRSADSAVVTPISSFYNQSEGTLFAEFVQTFSQAGNKAVVSLDANSASNQALLLTEQSPDKVRLFVDSGGVTQANVNAGSITLGSVMKQAATIAANDFSMSVNGASVVSDTAGSVPSGLTHLRAGSSASLGYNGHIRKIAYYPKRLSNTLLQQLTT